MRLNKEQKYALAYEIQQEYVKANDELRKSDEYINFENTLRTDSTYKTLKKIKELAEGLGEIKELPYHLKECKNAITSYVLRKRDSIYPNKYPSIDSIEHKIVLKTIECENLQELIDSVKESLK